MSILSCFISIAYLFIVSDSHFLDLTFLEWLGIKTDRIIESILSTLGLFIIFYIGPIVFNYFEIKRQLKKGYALGRFSLNFS